MQFLRLEWVRAAVSQQVKSQVSLSRLKHCRSLLFFFDKKQKISLRALIPVSPFIVVTNRSARLWNGTMGTEGNFENLFADIGDTPLVQREAIVAPARGQSSRPLEGGAEPSASRQRTTPLVSDHMIHELLEKMSSSGGQPAPHVKKHVRGCVEKLTRRIEKSLRIAEKKRVLIDQANSLEQGRIPNGVKPFKVSVDIPELDEELPQELLNFSISFTAGCTFREAKEKLHICTTALNKVIDARVMEKQILTMKTSLTFDFFAAECEKLAVDRTAEGDSLMSELGLIPGIVPAEPVPRDRLRVLYSSVIEKVAEARRIESEKKTKSEDSLAKKVEKLRNVAPHELLDAKIKMSVAAAIGKKKVAEKFDPTIDYGAAFSMVQADRHDLLETIVEMKPPPGLDFHAVRKKDRQKSSTQPEKGKGKGKGKEKGKNKDKSQSSYNKQEGSGKGKGADSSGKRKGGRGKNVGATRRW